MPSHFLGIALLKDGFIERVTVQTEGQKEEDYFLMEPSKAGAKR